MATLVYVDGDGVSHTLSKVQLGSASGFEGNTGTVSTISNADYSAMLMTRISRESRELSLTIPVYNATETAQETEENQYLSWFRQSENPGRLEFTRDDGTTRVIDVYVSRGYPTRTRVCSTMSWLKVGFTAVNPYWRAQTPVTTSGSFTNDGDYPATVVITPTADTVTYGGGTITARTGQSIIGVTITITDSEISAVSGSTNVLHRIDLSSSFGLLPVGTSTITGGSMQVTKRWGNS